MVSASRRTGSDDGLKRGAAVGLTGALLVAAAYLTFSEPSASALGEHADDGYWAAPLAPSDGGAPARRGGARGPPDWEAIDARPRLDPSATWFRPRADRDGAPRAPRTFRTQSTRADWRVTVKGALELLGLVETNASDEFDVFWGSQWTDHATFFDVALRPHMQVNSIMGIASETLGDKELLGAMRSLCRARHGPAHCEHIPEIYTMPMELHGFKRATARHTYWVKKDKAQWGNKGVSFITRHDFLPHGDYTLQRYLMMPLLWRGFKFDMRLWVAIASVEPLRVYMLQDGWARVSSVRYNVSELHYGEPCMHLTLHYCMHAKAASLRIFQLNDAAFRSGLPRRAGGWVESLWPSLQRAVLKTIMMAWPVLVGYERHLLQRGQKSRRFSFLSFDAMFEWADPAEPPAPMILECNSNGFMMGSRIPNGWEYTVDALRLLGVAGYNRSAYQPAFGAVARATCDAWRCSADEADALQDLADESAHRGMYAHLWPPTQLARDAPHAAPFFHAGAGAGRWNELTLAFAQAYFERHGTAAEDASKLVTTEAVQTEGNRTQWDIFGVQDEWWQAKLAIKMHNRQLRESIMKAKGYFDDEEQPADDTWWIKDGKVLALRRWRSTVAQLLKSANATRASARRTLQIVNLEGKRAQAPQKVVFERLQRSISEGETVGW
ncbi:hypothetical protein KFE25_013019 [Diacronema lutheri]|uniref:Tubulin--tyrosine ligase-like protein 9 n=1 Tax=Diacronema lutheri TaxID=2081491 RepID=A0A8J6C9F7_DIALT|nr:hypothetical protein KFE25_013019 [Diacronema lutheri]